MVAVRFLGLSSDHLEKTELSLSETVGETGSKKLPQGSRVALLGRGGTLLSCGKMDSGSAGHIVQGYASQDGRHL